MADTFSPHARSLIAGATHVFLITPDDDTDLDFVTRAISFAGAGALEVIMADDSAAVIVPDGALSAGILHPIRVKRVRATGTTATGIVGWY